MRIILISVGVVKGKSPYQDLFHTYLKRMQWSVDAVEIDTRKFSTQDAQCDKILDYLNEPGGYVVALDERGKTLGSQDFSDKMSQLQMDNLSSVTFIIGGADGLTKAVRQKADFLMSFGKQTWPHQMVRVMLIEQIYRAQQILAGHPYHRE